MPLVKKQILLKKLSEMKKIETIGELKDIRDYQAKIIT